MVALENYCAFWTDLSLIEFQLLPTVQNAPFLNDIATLALATMKSKARAMQKPEKFYLKGIKTNSLIYRLAKDFGDTLFGITEDVLKGAQDFNGFQASIPSLTDLIHALGNAQMEFGRCCTEEERYVHADSCRFGGTEDRADS